MPDFDELQRCAFTLYNLLRDREEGQVSWCTAVAIQWQSIARMWTGPTWTQDEKQLRVGHLYLLCYCSNDQKNSYIVGKWHEDHFSSLSAEEMLEPTFFMEITSPRGE